MNVINYGGNAMFGPSVVVLTLVFASPIVSIEHDVVECRFREGKIPFSVSPDSRISSLRLFASDDRGKTWKLVEERKATENRFNFKVAKDGVFWFASQSVQNDGKLDPPELRLLVPSLKIYVNQERRLLIRRPDPQLESQKSD